MSDIKFNYGSTMQLASADYCESNHSWQITMTGKEWPWIMKSVKMIVCPDCFTTKVHVKENYIKGGKRYTCLNKACKTETFIVR